MKVNNSPTGELTNIPTGTATDIVTCLRQLAIKGEPCTVKELDDRLNEYFDFCGTNDMRCGIETLSLALGVNRSKFWRWCQGLEKGQNPEWQTKCTLAKQYVTAFLEQLTLRGQLNPASSCFFLKNWAGYKDKYDIATDNEGTNILPTISATDIPDVLGVGNDINTESDNLFL